MKGLVTKIKMKELVKKDKDKVMLRKIKMEGLVTKKIKMKGLVTKNKDEGIGYKK